MDTMNLTVSTVTNNPPTMSNSDHASSPRQGTSCSGPNSAIRGQNGGGNNQVAASNRNRPRGGAQRNRRGRQSGRLDSRGNSTKTNNDQTINASKGCNKGPKGSVAPGGGKHKQRHATDMYLDELTLAGLDLDLAESIVPTTSTSGPASQQHHQGRNASSRKLNLTHLLNYNFDGRNRSSGNTNNNNNQYSNFSRSSGNHHRIGNYHKDKPMRFSKQQFLQANCQFVVLSGHDYSIHKADPDLPVDWDKVEEIRFFQTTSTETTCPICLNPPIAAKITRCGHIYCWPCMLHYLSLSDENCRQCPICFGIVYQADLRSVVSHTYNNYSNDDEITLRLMIRPKGSVDVYPYFDNGTSEEEGISDPEVLEPILRKNLLIVDGQAVLDNTIERERKQLELQREADKDEPEVCFIMEALSLLSRRAEKMDKTIEAGLIAELAALGCDSPDTDAKSLVGNDRNPKAFTISGNPQSDYREDGLENRSFKNYLFYQSIDGQHIYLNAFNTKVLCHEYQNIEHCPPVIKAKIIQMDWISMTEAWRRRYRFLEHLPLTCEFRLVEIELANYDYVSEATYKNFEGEIMKRELERQRRMRAERKREKIIRVEQNRKIYGIQPSLKISLDNPDQFPSVMDERFLGMSQPTPNRRNDTDDEDAISSDDEDVKHHMGRVDQSSRSQEDKGQSDANEFDHLVDGLNDVTTSGIVDPAPLSFREIQLQEAAAAELTLKNKKAKAQASKSAWGQRSSFAQLLIDAKQGNSSGTVRPNNSQQSIQSQQQQQALITPEATKSDQHDGGGGSSFAKLLVDAKSSQWTTRMTKQPPTSSSNTNSSNSNPTTVSRTRTRTSSNQTDQSDDESSLTRPTHEFNLADFIQFNVITGKKKGKKGAKKSSSPNK